VISDKRINIIYGEEEWLEFPDFTMQISHLLKDYKICLLCQSSADFGWCNIFEYKLIATKSDDRIYKMISQMSDKYDILIIDEFEKISESGKEILSNIKKPIIITTNSMKIPDSLLRESQLFILNTEKIKDQNYSTIEFDNTKMFRWDFFAQLQRDIKINSLLDEKQC
jgi:hypothetical protein